MIGKYIPAPPHQQHQSVRQLMAAMVLAFVVLRVGTGDRPVRAQPAAPPPTTVGSDTDRTTLTARINCLGPLLYPQAQVTCLYANGNRVRFSTSDPLDRLVRYYSRQMAIPPVKTTTAGSSGRTPAATASASSSPKPPAEAG